MLDFVHNEALADVMDLYKVFGLSTTSTATEQEVDEVIKAYVLQLVDLDNPIESRENMHETEMHMIGEFPGWGDFQLWVDDVRRTISMERSRRSFQAKDLTFGNVVEDVLALNDHLGSFQDVECRTLKAGLAELEYKGTGRVLLSDFYRAGLKGDFLFNENSDFLRKLGALDESDIRHPSVIITNYLASQANCLASTGFHSICCIDECEGLMSHLESAIAEPKATPGRIVEVVSGLRSDTVDAPRNLSASLLTRLGEIADHHDGLVPLHGRLFAQWMHHAYPLECSFPHAAGTTTPLTANEWMDESGRDQVATTVSERKQFINDTAAKPAKVEVLPWTAVEELVVHHRSAHADEKGSHTARKLAAFAAVMAMAVSIIRASAAYTRPGQEKCEKHLV